MKLNICCFLFLLIFINTIVVAQTMEQKTKTKLFLNSINIEKGNTMGGALIYERRFSVHKKIIITSRLGFGINKNIGFCFMGVDVQPTHYKTIPVSITTLVGKNKRFLEAGVGATHIKNNVEKKLSKYAIIGYRYLPLKNKKLVLRVLINVEIAGNYVEPNFLFKPLNVSVGWVF